MIGLWCICLVIIMQNLQVGVGFSRHLEEREKGAKNLLTLFADTKRLRKKKRKRDESYHPFVAVRPFCTDINFLSYSTLSSERS